MIPQATYGSAVVLAPKTAANALATKAARIMWGENFAMRAPELVQAVVLTQVRHHPY